MIEGDFTFSGAVHILDRISGSCRLDAAETGRLDHGMRRLIMEKDCIGMDLERKITCKVNV